jgi:phosphate binding protein
MTRLKSFWQPVLIIIFVLLTLPGNILAQQDTPVEIVAALEADGQFTTLVALIDAIELRPFLTGQLTFTVFAPTDEALSTLSPTVIEYLLANPTLLERVLFYHILASPYSLDEIFAETSLPTIEGSDVTINAAIRRINGADLIGQTIEAENGVIYPIDSVMIPEIVLPPADPFINFESILTSGSSTVAPLTERMREQFILEGFSGNLVVEQTGTNVGIERFCVNTETDIANASRPIRASEVERCIANGRIPIGFFVAVDALAVVVSRENDFLQTISREALARVFTGEFQTWDEVDPAYPNEPIQGFSPGDDSGTFVYFTEAVIRDGLGISAADAQAAMIGAPNVRFSEDDNVLVAGVENNPYAIGYFGFAYYIANQERLRVIDIEGVTPTEATAESGEYPLSRPLFIYSSPDVMRAKPQVAEFINFYINNVRAQLGTGQGQIGYFPVNRDVLNLDRLEWLVATAR